MSSSLPTSMTDPVPIHPLLDGLVDFAGLFPPATLGMREAIDSYASHQRGDDASMLGRFIVPVERLGEIASYSHRFDDRHPLRLSLLVAPDPDRPIAVWLDEALTAARSFVEAFDGPARLEVVETRLTGTARGEPVRLSLCAAADAASPLPVFVELPVSHRTGEALAALTEFGPCRESGRRGLGAKIRCGGGQPADYPTPEAVAAFLFLCVRDGVPFKATAGLHHPVRGVPSPEGPPMHGFLNVFGAAVLGATLGLTEHQMVDIVSEVDPRAFTLEDGRFGWKDFTAPIPAVQTIRAGMATAFGSCSFDEPTGDLRSLGWLR